MYEGNWKSNKLIIITKDDLKNGIGKLTISNGDVYEGEWAYGKKTGRGVYSFKNKEKYEG